MRVLLLGATGTIGQATAQALLNCGHEVVCLLREKPGANGETTPTELFLKTAGADVQFGTSPRSSSQVF